MDRFYDFRKLEAKPKEQIFEFNQPEIPKEFPKHPRFEACFHGETWYTCPWCGDAFEFYEPMYGESFKKINGHKNIYLHKCGHLIEMN